MNRFNSIQDTVNNVSITDQAKKAGITISAQGSRLQTEIKRFLKQKAIRSNKQLYNAIKNDNTGRKMQSNLNAWKQAYELYSNSVPKGNLQPVTTIFKAHTIENAFNIAKQQHSTLTPYEGALLMYNTIVSKYNVEA